MRWYADNSEVNGIRGADIPDIVMFGGVVVAPDIEPVLREIFESVKGKFGHPRAPVKWNFKDLERLYEEQQQKSLYKKLLKTSKEWRCEIVERVAQIDFGIIVSCIESYSTRRKDIKQVKDGLSAFAFNNGLMRYALHVRERTPERADVILDWPDKGNRRPFDVEYRYAFNCGRSPGGQPYHSGPLRELRFHDSVLFTNMHHCSLLQLSDIVIGASREFVECALGKRQDGHGLDCFKLLLQRVRGYPHNVVAHGFSVSTGNTALRNKISGAVRKLVNEGA
jgi:hypothetical protein